MLDTILSKLKTDCMPSILFFCLFLGLENVAQMWKIFHFLQYMVVIIQNAYIQIIQDSNFQVSYILFRIVQIA